MSSTRRTNGCLSFGADPLDREALEMAIGHEIGHALGMANYTLTADPWHNPSDTSIMRAILLRPDPVVAHTFLTSDLDQLRLKQE